LTLKTEFTDVLLTTSLRANHLNSDLGKNQLMAKTVVTWFTREECKNLGNEGWWCKTRNGV